MHITGQPKFRKFSLSLFMSMVFIILLGFIAISSVSSNSHDFMFSFILKKHTLWVIVGFILYFALLVMPMTIINDWAYVLYFLGLFFLLVILIIGDYTQGSRRWLDLGVVNFQPSEMIKLLLIFALARYLDVNNEEKPLELKSLVIPLSIVLIPAILILLEPDLGTALSLCFIGGAMLFFVGISKVALIYMFFVTFTVSPFGWLLLKDYQKERILSFLDPSCDPLGSGYNVLQSMIAIGSGGMIGKGYMDGTQSQLYFLPERHTDFIFSVFSEEWGFVGGVLLICCYAVLLFDGLYVAKFAKNKFFSLVAFGICMSIFFQVFVNLGMIMGMLPVVGIPLPLFSYGGSSIIITMIALGFLQRIYKSSFVF